MKEYLPALFKVRADIEKYGESRICPFRGGVRLCDKCEDEFPLTRKGKGCPCLVGYSKEELLTALNKWIKEIYDGDRS